MKKIQEAVKVNNGKLVYVVQLTTENNEKLQLYYEEKKYNGPGITFSTNEFSFCSYNVFDINSEGHRIAKEIFLTHLQTEIKTKILELKQLELVLDELGLIGIIRKTIAENATILLNVKDEIIEETIKATDKIIEKQSTKKVLKALEENKKNTEKIIDAKIQEQVRPIARRKIKQEVK